MSSVLKISDSSETIEIGDKLSEEQVGELAELLDKHRQSFSLKGELGTAKHAQHSIEFVPGAKPMVEPMRRRPQIHVEETNRQICEMLQQGIIDKGIVRADAIVTSNNAHRRAKARYDAHRRELKIEIRQQLLSKTSGRRKKLGDRYEGPFEVVSRENDIYELKDPN